MDKKTVSKMLEGATPKDYIEIIAKMSKCGGKAENVIIDWCKKNNGAYRKQAIEIELENLWNAARQIIQQFNAYGGGPESEEEDAADKLWKMDEIVKESEVSWEVRVAILDEMLEEFEIGNSGFDDLLIDVADSFCKSMEEKRYLADALSAGGNAYYRNYAAHIYQSIGDEEQFLKTKLANLHYGSDYVEVAKYFAKKGNRDKALEYIWKGLEKSSGRLDELIDYIMPIFRKEKNEKAIQRLYQFVMKTQWDVNIAAMARQMFEYAKSQGDYDTEKKMLLQLLNSCEQKDVKKWYETCRKEFTEEDWQKEYDGILEAVQKKNLKFYLDICMETGKEEVVLKRLQSANHGYDYWDIDYKQYFSKRLVSKYPDEVLALYWRDVEYLLQDAKQKNYSIAVSCLQRIKALMRKLKRQTEWERKFSDLKVRHGKKRNFMAMLGDL